VIEFEKNGTNEFIPAAMERLFVAQSHYVQMYTENINQNKINAFSANNPMVKIQQTVPKGSDKTRENQLSSWPSKRDSNKKHYLHLTHVT
jgi:phosphopantothenoylcysteine synthetase/decarboxylase